jgi:hypothetical protein
MSTRQRWVLGAIGVLVVILVGVGIAVAAGGGGNDTIDATATTLATSTTTSTTLVETPTTSGTTTVTVGIICTTPEDAAKGVVSAWEAGDRPAAARCASQAALDELFKASGAGATWTFQGCGGPDPGLPTCQFSYVGGAANFKMTGTEAAGWKVDQVSYIAD